MAVPTFLSAKVPACVSVTLAASVLMTPTKVPLLNVATVDPS